MWFIGDVHGRMKKYDWILQEMLLPGGKNGLDCSLQVGDMGLMNRDIVLPVMQQHKFFRGNHDDPALCRKHPNNIGDTGYLEKQGIFFVAGGFSIDYKYRIPGISWWEDEELSVSELGKVIESYKTIKPSIVVSHECPTEVKEFVCANESKFSFRSRTEQALQAMLDIHRPDRWIFGHYHQYQERRVSNTLFVCLGEMISCDAKDCVFEIPEIKW